MIKVKTTSPKTAKLDSFAIFKHKNQQYKVKVGSVVFLDLDQKLQKKQTVVFDKILVLDQNIGNPYLKNIQIIGKCLDEKVKGQKIIVFKYKAKKNYRVKTGHRTQHTKVIIEKFERLKP